MVGRGVFHSVPGSQKGRKKKTNDAAPHLTCEIWGKITKINPRTRGESREQEKSAKSMKKPLCVERQEKKEHKVVYIRY